MHVPINVKSPNNIIEWEMGFNSAFKGLNLIEENLPVWPSHFMPQWGHIDWYTPFARYFFQLSVVYFFVLRLICTELLILKPMLYFVCLWRDSPHRARASSFTRFLDHTQRRSTVGRTPLDEWSARRRDLYLTTHNTHNRQTSIPPRWDSNPQSRQASGPTPTP